MISNSLLTSMPVARTQSIGKKVKSKKLRIVCASPLLDFSTDIRVVVDQINGMPLSRPDFDRLRLECPVSSDGVSPWSGRKILESSNAGGMAPIAALNAALEHMDAHPHVDKKRKAVSGAVCLDEMDCGIDEDDLLPSDMDGYFTPQFMQNLRSPPPLKREKHTAALLPIKPASLLAKFNEICIDLTGAPVDIATIAEDENGDTVIVIDE